MERFVVAFVGAVFFPAIIFGQHTPDQIAKQIHEARKVRVVMLTERMIQSAADGQGDVAKEAAETLIEIERFEYIPPPQGIIKTLTKDTLKVGAVGFVPTTKIAQVVDSSSIHISIGGGVLSGYRCIIRGIDTTNLVDDMPVDLQGMFKVTGTEQYATVIGSSNKVFVLQPTAEASKELIAAYTKAKDLYRSEVIASNMREWTDKTGSYTVRAALRDYCDRYLKLWKEDLSTIDVPFERLSTKDLAFARAYAKTHYDLEGIAETVQKIVAKHIRSKVSQAKSRARRERMEDRREAEKKAMANMLRAWDEAGARVRSGRGI